LLASASVDTYQAAVARAAELAGGVQALSARLRLPVVDLMRWIQGEAKPPKGVFLRLVDLIVEEGKRTPPPETRRRSPAPFPKKGS
jgi:hypothetical protein